MYVLNQYVNVFRANVCGCSFVLVTDDNPFVTPFNLSLLNNHVVAGPAVYIAG